MPNALGEDEEESPRTPASPRRESRFERPTDRLDRRTVTRTTAAPSSRAGQFKRKTMTLPPEEIEYIEELAARERVAPFDSIRWLVDRGLLAYESGERPQIAGMYRERETIQMEHETSITAGEGGSAIRGEETG